MRWVKWVTTVCLLLSLEQGCSTNAPEAEYPDCIAKPEATAASRGCGDIFVYQFLDNNRAVTVQIDARKIKLTKKCRTYQLGYGEPRILVKLEEGRGHPDSVYFNYCTDYGLDNLAPPKIYNAISGTLTMSVSDDDPVRDIAWGYSYFVTIEIENLHLRHQKSGDEFFIEKIVFWDVEVGWRPG